MAGQGMKKEPKKSLQGEPINLSDLSSKNRVCHRVYCDRAGIHPYIFCDQIVYYCDEHIGRGEARHDPVGHDQAGRGKTRQG
jgi:hypothetical protein